MIPNIHPPLAVFPPALIVTLITVESIQLFKKSIRLTHAADILCIAAALGVIAAFFSGYHGNEFAQATFKVNEDLIAEHHTYGRLLLILFLLCAVIRVIARYATHGRAVFLSFYWLLLVASGGLVVWTGHLGGQLVFVHGAGVSRTP